MIDESHVFGAGSPDSVLHPAVLAAMIIAVVLIFSLSRKYVLAPLLSSIVLIPIGQQVVAFGVHWYAARIIILCALLRSVGMSRPLLSGGINSIDRVFFGFHISMAVAFVLLHQQTAAAVNQAGSLIDSVGAYLILRCLISDEADAYRSLKILALLTLVLGACMLMEQITLQNVFGMLGGMDAVPQIRNGSVRSQGAFLHAITAGAFGATLVPLFLILWVRGRARFLAAIAILSAITMTVCSHSSTPVLAFTAGIAAVCSWPARSKMKAVRWVLVAGLAFFHIVMNAPVWFLIARIDLTGGSSSYHRALLVDAFIQHFWDWWLIGVKQTEAATWAFDLWDQQNQYVAVGQSGGIIALILLFAVIARSYRKIGIARLLSRSDEREWTLWLIGASLFATVVAWFGVNYFDQSRFAWLTLLAVISVFTNAATSSALKQSRHVAVPRAEEETFTWPLTDCDAAR